MSISTWQITAFAIEPARHDGGRKTSGPSAGPDRSVSKSGRPKSGRNEHSQGGGWKQVLRILGLLVILAVATVAAREIWRAASVAAGERTSERAR